MQITEVTEADFNEWVSLAHKLWPGDMAGLREGFMKILASPRETGFLVKNNEVTIGFINLSLRYEYVPGATQSPVAYVEGIYVKKPYRKQGVGTALIQFAEQWALQHGCCELASDALLDNTASQEFHSQVGFQEVERVVAFIKQI